MIIYDISLNLDDKTAVYPGDPEVELHQEQTIETHGWNLTKISMGTHNSTHIDSLRHISDDGWGIDSIPLNKCLGKCKVLDLTHIQPGQSILRSHLEKFIISKDSIILLKTQNSKVVTKDYHSKIVSLNSEAAQFLVEKQVKAIGIDGLSIGNKETHKIILQKNILIYESLNLRQVEAGQYYFIGLPLKMKTEGSPVRAILIEGFSV